MEIKTSKLKNEYGKVYVNCGYEMLQVNDTIVVKLNGIKIFKAINTNNNWYELKRMVDREVNR